MDTSKGIPVNDFDFADRLQSNIFFILIKNVSRKIGHNTVDVSIEKTS